MNRHLKRLIALVFAVVLAFSVVPQAQAQAKTQTSIVVTNQKELNAALKNSSIKKIIIKTDAKISLNIKAGSLKEIAVEIDNKSILNKLTLSGTNGTMKMLIDGKLSNLIIKSNIKLNIKQNGILGKVTVSAPSDITMSGSSNKKTSIVVKSAAEGTSINSDTPIKLNTSVNIDVKLNKGSEGSSVKLTEEGINASVTNNTEKKVVITDNNGTKKNVKPSIKKNKKKGVVPFDELDFGDEYYIRDEHGVKQYLGTKEKLEDITGIYTDEYGNRSVMVPEGMTSDPESYFYDENGRQITSYLIAVDAQMSDIAIDNDLDNFIHGNTKKGITEYLVQCGYSKKEIEFALRDYNKTPQEETDMLVEWAMFSGTASKDTIEEYVEARGGDKTLIKWEMLDDDIGLKNYIANLQSEIPNVTLEDAKKFAQNIGGFTDVSKVEKYFNMDIYNSYKK